jgi:hypothetical protein
MPKPRNYHYADESTLQQWRDTGDPRADFELYHRHTVKQMVADVTADPPTSHAPPCYVIHLDAAVPLYFIKRLFGPLNTITMLLDPTTPRQAMNRHWGEIQAWRHRLERWQGVRPRGDATYLSNLKGWHQAWQSGALAEPSLSDLAQWVNREIAGALQDALDAIQESHGGTLPIPLERLLEYPSWRLPRDHWSYVLAYPVMLMEWFGVPRHEIRATFLEAMEHLKAGKPAFDRSDEPLSSERMWGKLKRLPPAR